MPTKLKPDAKLTMLLQTTSPQMALAAETVAQCLHIPLSEALARLSEVPGRLAVDLSAARARRLGMLLRLLGVQVTMQSGDDEQPHRFEVALQAGNREGRAALTALVADLRRAECAISLDLAACVVIEGLDWPAVSAMRRRIKGVAGLRVLVSDPDQASYDLIPLGRPADPDSARDLARHLQRLGLARCALTGAVGADLDAPMRHLVLARFPQAGVVALNRDFQRFDLILTGAPDPSRRELADFLSTRTSLPHAAFASGNSHAGLRIECSLTRADTLAFQADYAAIGIETRPQLVFTGEGRTA
ncbi:MAG: hypothetical protein ACT4OK_07350 [Gemmobacter sp.]